MRRPGLVGTSEVDVLGWPESGGASRKLGIPLFRGAYAEAYVLDPLL